MIAAISKDRSHVVSLLAQAFKDNKSVNYIVKQDYTKTARIRALMEYSFDMCFIAGEVYLSDDRNGCALLLPPGAKPSFFRSLWLDLKLIVKAIGVDRINIALKRERMIKEKKATITGSYLWFIGVDPAVQHQGIGTRLLAEITTLANQKSMPICLETSTEQNLPWYKRFGFEIYDELDLGYRLYFLKQAARG